jgi:hypothetical protein
MAVKLRDRQPCHLDEAPHEGLVPENRRQLGAPGLAMLVRQSSLALDEGRPAWVTRGQPGQGTLNVDKLAPGVAPLLQPIGVDEAGDVVGWVRPNGLEQPRLYR